MKISILRTTVLVSLAVLIGGCSSTTSTTATNAGSSLVTSIYKGMPASDLLELLSEPTEVRYVDPPREGFEIWVYGRSMKHVEYRAVTTELIPFYDPLTGEYKPMREPVMRPETTAYTAETQFLIADGTVVSWKSNRNRTRDYD